MSQLAVVFGIIRFAHDPFGGSLQSFNDPDGSFFICLTPF